MKTLNTIFIALMLSCSMVQLNYAMPKDISQQDANKTTPVQERGTHTLYPTTEAEEAAQYQEAMSISTSSFQATNESNTNFKAPSRQSQQATAVQPETANPNGFVTINLKPEPATTTTKDQPKLNDQSPAEGRKKYNGRLPEILKPAKKRTVKENPTIEIDKIEYTNDLLLADLNCIADFVALSKDQVGKEGSVVVKTPTLNDSLDASLPDTQAINSKIKNFDKNTLLACKDGLTQLKILELEGKPLIEDQKKAFARSFIQSQLETIFPKSSSMEETASFNKDTEEELVDKFLKSDIFNANTTTGAIEDPIQTPKRDTVRLQDLATMKDQIMNKISEGDPINTTFKTEIDSQANSTVTMTKKDRKTGKTITTKSQIDRTGKLMSRILIVDNPKDHDKTSFSTTIDPKTGKSKTFKFTPLKNSSYQLKKNEYIRIDLTGNEYLVTELTSRESEMTYAQYAVFQAVTLGKMMLKLSLWSTKQIAFSAITHPIPQAILFGCIAPLALLVKGGSMAAGYKYEDPTIIATFGTVIDLTMGNKRAILSNGEYVFSPGSTLHQAAYKINPFDKRTAIESKEEDPNNEYYGFDTDIGNALIYGIKQLFPDTFGDSLVPKASVDNANGIAPVNRFHAAVNKASTTMFGQPKA